MTTSVPTTSVGYAFSNSVPQAPQQLDALSTYLDPITLPVLEQTGLGAGARCLELGPGGGSIAHWLAGQTAPGGTVTAVDIDPSRLAEWPGLTIVQHDLRQGMPAGAAGPYDLIHARLVLVHLPNRRELFDQLVGLLAPGGWLVLGEFSGQPLAVQTAADPADADLFTRVIDTFRDALVAQHGADVAWAHQVHGEMARAGLTGLRTIEYAESWTGGEPGCQLHIANLIQKRDQMLAAGLTADELARFLELMADPAFSARSWQFVCTRGQRLSG